METTKTTLDGQMAPASSTELTDRALAGWEIVSVASSIVIAEWMLASAAGFRTAIIAVPVALAFLLIVLSHRVRGETFYQMGFRLDNVFAALYKLIAPVMAVCVACLIVGWRLGSSIDFLRWHPKRYLALQLTLGFFWALAQQYVLQGFFNRRAMISLGRGWRSVLVVALVFGLLHLPNLWVTIITLFAGAVWAAVYQRAPNLFALAITHSVMTWFIVSTLPPASLHHLRVGLGYFF